MADTQQQEVDKNYSAFQSLGREFYHKHQGKYALLKKQQVIEVFDTCLDADKVGTLLFKSKPYSIQKVSGYDDIDNTIYSAIN